MIPNPWTVRLAALAGFAGAIFLASSFVNLAASPNLYAQPSGTGVLMPRVDYIPPKRKPKIDHTVEQPETFHRRVNFRVPNAEIDPMSFVSYTPGVRVQIISVKPVKETKHETTEKSILLLLDNSYSMVQPSPPSPWNRDWLPRADPEYKRIDAVKALVEVLGVKDRVALATFPRLNPSPGYRIPRVEPPAILKDFGPPSAVVPSLPQLRGNENSGTPLYRVLSMAVDWMSHEGDRPKFIVMLTDGRDTESNGGAPPGLREALEAAGIKVIIVALGPAPDLSALKELADELIPVSASDQLAPTFRKLAEKLETLVVGHDVELEFIRDSKNFENGEDVKIGFRSGETPEQMTVRIGQTAVTPTKTNGTEEAAR